MKKNFLFALLLLLPALSFAQNERFDWPVSTISSLYAPLLQANVPPNSPVLHVCHSPANQVPCTNYATTYTSLGVACANGAQDTPQPQPSSCQATGDAQGNVGFWAPPGKYDITICVENNCFNSPYTVTLGSASASGIDLKVNNVDNAVQSELNLVNSNGVFPFDNGDGSVEFDLHDTSGSFGSGCLLSGGGGANNLDLSCTPASYNSFFQAIQSNIVTPVNGTIKWQGASSGIGQVSSEANTNSPLVFWPSLSGHILDSPTAPLIADGHGAVSCPGCSSPSNGTFPVTAYGAVCDGATDDAAAISSAITAAAAKDGGTIVIPASTTGCRVASALTISANGINLRGVGWAYGAHQAPSTLLFDAGINGIISTGDAFKIQDLALVSKDSGANSDVGLRMTGGRPFLERVLIQSFGSHAFLWDSSTGGNTDHWYAASLRALSNFGDGFRFTGGADENVGTGIDMDASLNGGIGFDLVSGAETNSFITPHASQNVGGDYNIVSGSSNYFFNAYCESGIGPTFTIGSTAIFNRVLMPTFGGCTPVNNGNQSNDIYYTFASSQGTTQIFLNPPNAAAGGHTYEMSSGVFNPKDFSIRDVTGTADLLDYNANLNLWAVLNKPWYFANFAAATSGGGTNSGIGGWYAACWTGSVSATDLFSAQLLGGSGTNGTERLAFTHTPGCGVAGTYSFDGNVTLPSLATTTNCANGATPAVCAAAPSGAVAVPTGSNPTLTIDTSAVTATSRIFLTIDESLTIPTITCNSTLATLVEPVVTARTPGTSFTIQISATIGTNPACVSYMIVN